MNTYQYHMPTEIVFGPRALNTLPERCQKLGQKPLLVTGKHSARATGLLARVLAQFPEVALFDQVEENPTTQTCEAGGALCRAQGCDFVIGLGGGSPMDAAKAIAVLATNPPPCASYFGVEQYTQAPLPIVAVPTTAGTGSEVTPYSVLIDVERRAKRTITGKALFPRVALLDPELTVSAPRAVTAATGWDALSQAMEGMLSKKSTPYGDTLAIETCRLVRRALPRVIAEPGDIEARGDMLHAAMLSGCVIAQSGTTLVHGAGYYYTLNCGLAHGLANALLLIPVFRVNARCEPAKVAALAEALGRPCEATPDAAEAAIVTALYDLFDATGVSPAARDAGVKESALRAFADDLGKDAYRFKNQVGAFTAEDVYQMFRESWNGAPGFQSRPSGQSH
jgi:alcohol dehydrogenase class IV